MPSIRFKAKLYQSGESVSEALLTLPKDASAQLPSRGMTIVEGTINNVRFRAILEPDGEGSHWFAIGKAIRDTAGVKLGDMVNLEITPIKTWPEPELAADVKDALAADPDAHARWMDITPMAR